MPSSEEEHSAEKKSAEISQLSRKSGSTIREELSSLTVKKKHERNLKPTVSMTNQN